MIKCNENSPIPDGEEYSRIAAAAAAYGDFLTALGFDWRNDKQMMKTPFRVAKAWVEDLAKGCFEEEPEISFFPSDGYPGLIVQSNIEVVSMCAHHALPFVGQAHVGLICSSDPGGIMMGLSKINRIVDWFARRPQCQELLTKQIHDYLNNRLIGNRGVAVVIEAQHQCVSCRGVRHSSTMSTSQLSGYFFTNEIGTRQEFFSMIPKR